MMHSAPGIAQTLLARNRRQGAGSINRYIQFCINRSGRNLADERKRAMALVRRHA